MKPRYLVLGGLLALLAATAGLAARTSTHPVHALFDLSAPAGGPFPSDRFTVPDRSQNTGRRVNLPYPGPAALPSDYLDVAVLNTLDGFNLQPRLSIPFDGDIDPLTVNSSTVFLISLGDLLPATAAGGEVVGINQIVWDPQSRMLHVESDELLKQHSWYVLLVTSGVRDPGGSRIEASESFRRFRQELNYGQSGSAALKEYRKTLLDALEFAELQGIRPKDVAAASVFSTVSATALLEKIRDQIKARTPGRAEFLLGPGGSRAVFPLDQVTGLTVNQQTGTNPPRFTALPHPVDLLRAVPGAVGRIAFGKFLAPNYETASGIIPQVGTRTGHPAVQGINELYFNLYLPAGKQPAAGWPVAIYGHGTGGSKQGGGPLSWGSLAVAASLAEQGVATLSINVVGHGFGPLGTLTITRTAGDPVTLPAGGRGIDQDGDGIIGNSEGLSAAPPWSIVRDRDGLRQTVADLMQLVRVVEVGMDADGDGLADLDPARIYYVGQSLGGYYGTQFLAVEPNVRVGAANVAGGSPIESNRLSVIFRPSVGASLASRTPSLVNSPGVTHLDGVPVAAPQFDENMPLRDGVPLAVRLADGTERVVRSPVTNTVAGAMQIQEMIERIEWVSQPGDPVAYAAHVRRFPLAGVGRKSVIYQFAQGDQIVPNPANTALIRAGALAGDTTLYRHDLAFAENPLLPKIPHAFLTSTGNPAWREIALGAQRQIAIFLASDGTVVSHPEPARFFETPIVPPLPEGLNYIP